MYNRRKGIHRRRVAVSSIELAFSNESREITYVESDRNDRAGDVGPHLRTTKVQSGESQ
jgi:hypothetical protein